MTAEPRVRGHVAGATAVALFFFAALAVLLIFTDPASEPQPVPSPQPTMPVAAGQETMLVQVTLDRARAASLLTAIGGQPDHAVLLSMPQDLLLVDGPTYTPLLDANLSLNRRLTARAADNTLGVRVDGGWRMERKALAGFVDSVGGVTVEVAQATTYLDEFGQPVLTLPAGTSRLAGPEASWYVMGVVQEEDPIAGVQARFAEIFVEAVGKLPDNADEVSATLTSLGALSDPLNGTDAVARMLLQLREDFLAGEILPVNLPLRPSAAADPVVTRQELEGGPEAAIGAFRVTDYEAATPVIRTAFAGAPRLAGVDGPPRALVWNATSEPLASAVALQELTEGGFVAMSAGNWSSMEQVSRITGLGYQPDGVSHASAAAEALRLVAPQEYGETGTISPVPSPSVTPSAAATMPAPDRLPLADVDVVFGADYRPCPVSEPDCLDQEKN